MYCQKCGYDCEKDKYCQKCGTQQVPMTVETKKQNACAIVGFILSFIMPMVGIILGIIGVGINYKYKPEGKALAIGAIAIGTFSYVASFVSLLWVYDYFIRLFEIALPYMPK